MDTIRISPSALAAQLSTEGFLVLSPRSEDAIALDLARTAAARIFALAESQKLALRHDHAMQRGYSRVTRRDGEVAVETWHVGRECPTVRLLHGRSERNIWPPDDVSVRTDLERAHAHLLALGCEVSRQLAVALGADADVFTPFLNSGDAVLRPTLYGRARGDTGYRVLPHCDANFLTLVPVAADSGLEIQSRDGRWNRPCAEAGGLLVLAGRMLAELTDGAVWAAPHCAVTPPGAALEARLSIPFFLYTDLDLPLDPPPPFDRRGTRAPGWLGRDHLLASLRSMPIDQRRIVKSRAAASCRGAFE